MMMWQYEGKSSYENFDQSVANHVEGLYQQFLKGGNPRPRFVAKNNEYSIDFKKNTQMSMITKKIRSVRRVSNVAQVHPSPSPQQPVQVIIKQADPAVVGGNVVPTVQRKQKENIKPTPSGGNNITKGVAGKDVLKAAVDPAKEKKGWGAAGKCAAGVGVAAVAGGGIAFGHAVGTGAIDLAPLGDAFRDAGEVLADAGDKVGDFVTDLF